MNFNKSQSSAIQHKDGPMLVLAGPGSGKTATLVERTKNLIVNYGVNPSNILVITFTKAAANEMKQRFEREMAVIAHMGEEQKKEVFANIGEDQEKTICIAEGDNPGKEACAATDKQQKTNDSIEYRKVPYGSKGYGRVTFGTFHAIFFMVLKLAYHYEASSIVTEDVKRQAIRESIRQYGLEYREENELITGILGEISVIKNSRILLEHFYSSQCGGDVFRKIFKDYDAFLRKHRLIDFDDMLLQTYELFTERPDILQAWQRKYQYILVDEFQDISQVQFDIVRMMAAPENNIFMVGDDDQSIYRFRGSKPEIMLHVPKDYPDIKQIQLDVNYRSQPMVIEAAQKLIAHNKERFQKSVTAHHTKAKPIIYREFSNQREEITYLLKTIDEQLKKGYQLSDMAILFRTNTQPRFLMEQLMAYNVDFKTRDQIPNLYEHWIAKDIRTYIRIARGSRARSDFLMIMNKPKRYIGRDSLCESQVVFDEWEKLYDEQPWIAERIEKLHYDIKMLAHMSPYAAINYIRHGIGYDEYIEGYADYRGISKEDLFEILEELQASAKGYQSYEAWEQHMKEYAEELREKARRKSENPNAITLATMHSAKGLEFKSVFIMDANEGITPYKKSFLDKDIEEERRLFYVAMTRAITDLTICSVKSIYNKTAEPSRFVAEAELTPL